MDNGDAEWFRCLREDEDPAELEQGELLFDLVGWQLDPAAEYVNDLASPPEMHAIRSTFIVVDQSCDLANSRLDVGLGNTTKQLGIVLACPVIDRETFLGNAPKANPNQLLEGIRIGRSVAHFLLKERIAEPAMAMSIVDLSRIFQFPYPFLKSHVVGQEHRFRLRSPMRESLSAAFGGRFSRVAKDARFEIPALFTAADRAPRTVLDNAFKHLGATEGVSAQQDFLMHHHGFVGMKERRDAARNSPSKPGSGGAKKS